MQHRRQCWLGSVVDAASLRIRRDLTILADRLKLVRMFFRLNVESHSACSTKEREGGLPFSRDSALVESPPRMETDVSVARHRLPPGFGENAGFAIPPSFYLDSVPLSGET